MSLTAGSQLGPYEIVGAIGAGGMGEVYRARDNRLGRDVAIKVVPSSFSADPDRLRRFEQEARAVAALNHPNILAVHDIGSFEGAPYIVTELLQGETLRERLSHSAVASPPSVARADVPAPPAGTPAFAATHANLSVRKAVEYAVQIAHGLSAAHDKRLVHRDLKPDNIFVTTDGRVRILDFGLAKLTQSDDAVNAEAGASTSTNVNTQPGMMLGTMGYMAPEQVRGLPVDPRADIFAFGVILYEMLAGRRAFQGATSADTVSAILKEDPPDLPVAERHIPPALERIVDRCLEKSPAARFQTATDLAFALESLSSHSDRSTIGATIAAAPARRSRERIAWMVAVVLLCLALIGTGVVTLRHLGEAPPELVRFLRTAPESTVLVRRAPLAYSPDGRQVVFGAVVKGVPKLWVQPLDALIASPLDGTDQASYPFWSPDSQSIGFFAGGMLKTVLARGGPVATVCPAPDGNGGTWNGDQTILFAPSQSAALQKVTASAGATPVSVTVLDKGETGHRWPWFLPDGRHFVYVALGISFDTGTLWVGSIDSSERTALGPTASNAQYASGHLLFVRNSKLVAEPFDPARRQVTGEAFMVVEDNVVPRAPTWNAAFSVSVSGALGYQVDTRLSQLTWFDRHGKRLSVVGDPAANINLVLSNDERRLAVSRESELGNIDIWLINLEHPDQPTKVTSDPAPDFGPVFSPDASQVVFTSFRDGAYALYRHASSGSGGDTSIFRADKDDAYVRDWSRDGRFLAYDWGNDVWVLPITGRSSSAPSTRSGPTERRVDWSNVELGERINFTQTPSKNERTPAFSADSHWIAYASTELGQPQIYVQPFPATGDIFRISTGGGTQPRWTRDDKEIVFLTPDGQMMAVEIDTAKRFQYTNPTWLFDTGIGFTTSNHPYVVTGDGQHFLIPVRDQSASQMTVVLNWLASVRKK